MLTRDQWGNAVSGPDGNNSLLYVAAEYRSVDSQIVHVSIDAPGSGYVAGKLRISGGAGAGFAATVAVNGSGAVISVLIGSGGSGYIAGDGSYIIEVLHIGTNEAQDGSIASAVVDGVAYAAYTDGGALTAVCTTVGCAGSGLVGTCVVSAGNVTAVVITAFGVGYNASALPELSCAGGAGQTFTAVVPSGVRFSLDRTRLSLLQTCSGSASCEASGGITASNVTVGPGVVVDNARYVATLGLTRAGVADITVGIASVGGLSATYYQCATGTSGDTCAFGAAAKTVLDATVDFSSVDAAPGAEVTWPSSTDLPLAYFKLRDASAFLVRWSGWVKSSVAGTHTFSPAVVGADERVKLWIDSNLVIDQWSSLAALAPSVAYDLSAGVPASLRLEYREVTGTQGVTLSATAPGGSEAPFASESLLRPSSFAAVPGGFVVTVAPRPVCAAASLAAGAALTLVTAHVPAAFTISARDAYGNTPASGSGDAPRFVVDLAPRGVAYDAPRLRAPLAPLERGRFEARFTATVAGAYTASIELAERGSLSATYYTDTSFAASVLSRLEDALEFASADPSSTAEWPGTSDEAFPPGNMTATFRGFLDPPTSGRYQLFTDALTDAQRVRVWIDQVCLGHHAPCWLHIAGSVPHMRIGR